MADDELERQRLINKNLQLQLATTGGGGPETFDEGTSRQFKAMFDAVNSGDIMGFLKTAATEFPVAGSLNLRRGGRIFEKGGDELGQIATAVGTEEGRQKLKEGVGAFVDAAIDSPGVTAKAIGSGILEQGRKLVTDPIGTIEESPMGLALDVAPLPGLGAANPLKFIPKGLAGLTKMGARAAGEVVGGAAGFLSRTGIKTPRKIFRAGVEGGELADVTKATRRQSIPAPQAKKEILDAARKLKSEGSAEDLKRLDAILKKAKSANDVRFSISMADIGRDVEKILKSFKIEGGAQAVLSNPDRAFGRVFGGSRGDQRAIASVVELLSERRNFTSIEEVLALRQRLDVRRKRASLVGNSRADAFIKEVRNSVDAQLKKIPGMRERDLLISKRLTLLDDVSKGLANPNSTNEQVAKKMATLLKDNIGERKRLIDELQDFSDVPLEGRALGLATEAWEPQTLIAVTAGVGVAASGFNPWLWAAIPFTSPRGMAEIFQAAGATKRVINAAVKDAAEITRLAKISGIATKGLTYGMVASRLKDKGEQRDIRDTAAELQSRLSPTPLEGDVLKDLSGLRKSR
tara:strand:+ start:226 stop:1953 length:1728 start_codon:yes stop_codon:yes gene_type:complete